MHQGNISNPTERGDTDPGSQQKEYNTTKCFNSITYQQ